MSWTCDLCGQDFYDLVEPAVGVEELGPTCASCYEGDLEDEDPTVIEALAADIFSGIVEG